MLWTSEKPDAIVCANDVTAARLMQTLVSLGVRIPGDIKMVGVDDVRYAKFLPTQLTSIRQNCIRDRSRGDGDDAGAGGIA